MRGRISETINRQKEGLSITTMSSLWTQSELDYLLSLSDLDLESWMVGFSSLEQAELMRAMLERPTEPASQQQTHQVRGKPELSDELGISLPTLAKYVRLGMPAIVTPYDVAACQRWIAEYREGRNGHETEGRSLLPARIENLTQRTKRDQIAAELETIELETTRGNILLADDVMTMLRQMASTSLTILESVEDAVDQEMPVQCPTPEAWAELRKRVLLAAQRIACDVASQFQALVKNDAG